MRTGTNMRQSGPEQATTTASCGRRPPRQRDGRAGLRAATAHRYRHARRLRRRCARPVNAATARSSGGSPGRTASRRRAADSERSWLLFLAVSPVKARVTVTPRGTRAGGGRGDTPWRERREDRGDGARAVGGQERGRAGCGIDIARRCRRSRRSRLAMTRGSRSRHAPRRLSARGAVRHDRRSGREVHHARGGDRHALGSSRRAKPARRAMGQCARRRHGVAWIEHEEADQQQCQVGERDQPDGGRRRSGIESQSFMRRSPASTAATAHDPRGARVRPGRRAALRSARARTLRARPCGAQPAWRSA